MSGLRTPCVQWPGPARADLVQAMLTIRRQQMAVLEAAMLVRFRARLLRDLRTDLPTETAKLPDKRLVEIINEGLLRSRRYGVTTERDVSLYVFLMVRHSPRFEETPEMAWAKKILLKPNLNGEGKMNLIYQLLAAREQPARPG